ncbi:MAG: DUF3332 domain-containing protein [Dysgonamonadaceae bacterium]|jgi:hypothetical protein|nr:DUF3332 domain-containing protein [Dysgonamonadaceae bacterium]
MKKNFTAIGIATLLGSSILFNSCIGSFSLTSKLFEWNKSAGNQWVNELVFLALAGIQVYSVSLIIDSIVLNTIEFWTGSNPSADVQVKKIKTEKGLFTITTDTKGHKIQKEGSGEIVEFCFNEKENSWILEANGETAPLLKFVEDNQAMVYLADGSTMIVSMDQAGVFALKRIIENKAHFASK